MINDLTVKEDNAVPARADVRWGPMRTLRTMGSLLAALVVGGCTSTGVRERGDSRISPTAYRGWSEAYRLENASASAVVVPMTGRLMHVGMRNGANVLRNDPDLLGRAPSETSTWTNYGGEWMWPVAQSRWSEFSAGEWPPPPALRTAPWEAEAWRTSDGRQSCRISRRYGAPLNVLVQREFTLDPKAARLTIKQRMVATHDTALPLTLWSIMQIDRPQQVVLPVRSHSAFTNGFRVMMNELPGDAIASCPDGLICDLSRGGGFKLGLDAREQWMAARRDDVLVLLRADHGFSGVFPDGNCSLELYASDGNTYAEIETLSPEFALRAGEDRANTLVVDLRPCDPTASACSLAQQVHQLTK